jgi:hypothetical protein
VAKITCSRCNQLIDSQAITCPYCRTEHKAFGHPGMTLHRAKGKSYLCESCTYHSDDTCTFPKRPLAKECTLYENLEERKQNISDNLQTSRNNSSLKDFNIFNIFKYWLQNNSTITLILLLLLISFLVVVYM